MDKVRDRMRPELALAWVRLPPYLKLKNHHNFLSLEASLRGSIYLSM